MLTAFCPAGETGTFDAHHRPLGVAGEPHRLGNGEQDFPHLLAVWGVHGCMAHT